MSLFLKGIKQIIYPRVFAHKFYGVLLDAMAPLLGDKRYLNLRWKYVMGYPLNLKEPHTFNEKLQWLKLYDRHSEYTKMVDKYDAKDYVSNILGREFVIPTLGVWESVDSIDFNSLPDQFVLKCTHDSGGVVVCKNKDDLDKKAAIDKLNKGLKSKFYWQTREWPYKNVKPRIIAEKYMEDESGYELKDYKFFCFNGKCEFFKIDFDRQKSHHANYFNCACELMPFGEVICPPDYNRELKMPSNIGEMINKAEQIASSINNAFVRIDLYNINGQIYFGEITFYPASGIGKFEPDEWDLKLGELIQLPCN